MPPHSFLPLASSSSLTSNCTPTCPTFPHLSIVLQKHDVRLFEVLSGEPFSKEAPGSRGGAVHFSAMPNHSGPGGPRCGQHSGGRGLRPVWRGGQRQCRTQHHHLLLHRCPGVHIRWTVLCRVWVPGSQDRLSIPLQLCDCRRTTGFYHWLESVTLLRHRQVWYTGFPSISMSLI